MTLRLSLDFDGPSAAQLEERRLRLFARLIVDLERAEQTDLVVKVIAQLQELAVLCGHDPLRLDEEIAILDALDRVAGLFKKSRFAGPDA